MVTGSLYRIAVLSLWASLCSNTALAAPCDKAGAPKAQGRPRIASAGYAGKITASAALSLVSGGAGIAISTSKTSNWPRGDPRQGGPRGPAEGADVAEPAEKWGAARPPSC